MDLIAYKIKDLIKKIKDFLHSTKFLRVWDKTIKILKIIVPQIAIYAILIAFSYIFMSPLLRVLVDSFKVKDDLTNPDVVWIPTTLTLVNYSDAFKGLWMWRKTQSYDYALMSTILNSTVYSLITAFLQTVVSCTAGYAFARFSFKGKKFWFAGLIMAFIIPTQLLTIPRSMMLRGLINATAQPSTFFKVSGTSAFINHFNSALSIIKTLPILIITMLGQGINSSILTFIAFSFFKMIPVALDEAAQIDGANFFQIFYHVILKMSIPTILVVFLFAFIWNWNDTYSLSQLTAIGMDQLSFKSLPESLSGFNYRISQGEATSGVSQKSQESNNAGLKSAAIIISILPLLILYAFTQKRFVEGIENTGVTGV